MIDALGAITAVFESFGWSVVREDKLSSRGFTVDAIFESGSAVVFCEALSVESLETKSRRLSAEVASAMQAASLTDKAWEAYLLLVCQGDLLASEQAIQSVQHDLTYCRKVVLSAEDIEGSVDPVATAGRLLAFLFPLRQASPRSDFDLRDALARHLTLEGIDSLLSHDLVAHFDEPSCRCTDRLVEFVSEQPERDQ